MMHNSYGRLQTPASIAQPCEQAIEITKGGNLGVGDDFFVVGRSVECDYEIAPGHAAVWLTMDDIDIRYLRDMCNNYLDKK